jgi:hypothetical protein
MTVLYMYILYHISAYIQHNGDVSLERKKSDILSVQLGVKKKSTTYT